MFAYNGSVCLSITNMDDVVERNPKHCIGKCLVLERWKEHRAGFNRNVGIGPPSHEHDSATQGSTRAWGLRGWPQSEEEARPEPQ